MTDSSEEPRRDLARRSVAVDRAAGLVDRGLALATAIAEDAFVSIAAGERHSLALKRDGSLWAWGWNRHGQLGLGDAAARGRPTRVGDDSDWAEVATGLLYTLALKRDGSLWVWGKNTGGQLGLGDTEDRDRPTRVGDASDWATVATGQRHACGHTLALKRDGSLWAWGHNDEGQLGLGDREHRDRPTRVGDDNDWAAVATGDEHTLALKSDGSLWAWGDNRHGELGLGDREDSDRPTRVGDDSDWAAAVARSLFGGANTLALKRDGSLWAWGHLYGEFGLDDREDRDRPMRVGDDSDWAAAAAAGVYRKYQNHGHTLALKRDGSLWAWGDNGDGQLGLGDRANRDRPTRIGDDSDWAVVATGSTHTLALKRDGSLWAWGDDGDGQLGLGGADRYRPTRVAGERDWAAVATVSDHSFALKRDGSLWEWGAGFLLACKLPTCMGSDSDWAAVATYAGRHAYLDGHTLALKRDGSLWAWGDNGDGQLGLGGAGDRRNRKRTVYRPTRIGSDSDWAAVATGERHTLALKRDGSLWVWGRNDHAQLGVGVRRNAVRYGPTRIGSDSDWAGVVVGKWHTLALKRDGSLWECGWGDNLHGDSLWAAVATGYDHGFSAWSFSTLALKRDGSLWAWGTNGDGRLGLGDSEYRDCPTRVGDDSDWARVATGDSHTLALKCDGSLWAWGLNDQGQLGLGDTATRDRPARIAGDSDWVAVAAGGNHTLALKCDGSLWAWGHHRAGQLGLGDAVARDRPTRVAASRTQQVSILSDPSQVGLP